MRWMWIAGAPARIWVRCTGGSTRRCATRYARRNGTWAVFVRWFFPGCQLPGCAQGCGGVSRAAEDLEKVHRGLLFTGGVEAADGTLLSYDSLPLTIFQVGVSLVSYQGHQGVWSHRLFRRDLRVTGDDPDRGVDRAAVRRESRDGLNQTGRRDHLARLARRGILSYAERAILLRRSTRHVADGSWQPGAL